MGRNGEGEIGKESRRTGGGGGVRWSNLCGELCGERAGFLLCVVTPYVVYLPARFGGRGRKWKIWGKGFQGREGRWQGGCYLSADVLSRVAFPVASTCRSRRGDGAALAVLSKGLCSGLRGLGGAEGKGLSVSHGLCEQDDSIVVLACLRHVRGMR